MSCVTTAHISIVRMQKNVRDFKIFLIELLNSVKVIVSLSWS